SKEDVAKSYLPAGSWFLTLAEDLQKKPLTRADGRKISQALATLAASEILDYDSARQVLWALKVVEGEAKGPQSESIQKNLDALGKEMFLLDLRKGRHATTAIPGEPKERTTTEVDLAIVLPFIANYDPLVFQKRFKEIADWLK